MADKENRNLIVQKIRAQALTEVKQFENQLLEAVSPEEEVSPIIACQPAEGVENIIFTPDGRHIAASMGRSIQIWDCQTGKCIQVLTGHTSSIRSLAMTPVTQTFLSGSWNEVILWDIKTGQPVWTQNGKCCNHLAIFPDGQKYVLGQYRGIHVHEMKTGENLFRESISTGFNSIAGPIVINPSGQMIASAFFDLSVINLCDLASGESKIGLNGHSASVKALAITPDGQTLISGSEDCTLRLWDLESRSCMEVLAGHYGSVLSVAVTPDGKSVVSGSEDKTIRVWDIQDGKQQQVLLGNLAKVQELAISPDGRTLASGGSDSTVILWDLKTGHPLRTLAGLTRSVTSVDLSTAELLVACTSTAEKVIRLRQFTPDGKCEYHQISLVEHRKNAGTAISPDHQLIAVGGRKYIYLYNVRSGQLVRRLAGHTDFAPAIKFSQDGHRLVSGSASLDKTWRVWDVQTGECLKAFNGRSEGQIGMYAIAFLPGGKRFLLSGVSKVSMCDIETGQHIRKVIEHHEPHMIMALAVHPDRKTFVTGAWGENIRLWDLETGILLRVYEGHQRFVSSLTFSQNGRLLISGSEGGVVNYWDYDSGELLATAHNVDAGYLWTTPPDDFATNGWLFTDRPDLVSLKAMNQETGSLEYISEDDERFINYMRLYNDGEMVMNRINEWTRYKELLFLRANNHEELNMKMIEARVKTDQLYQLQPGDLSAAENEES